MVNVEQARSLSHILHHYLVTKKTNRALLAVLKQLNSAEKADLDFHEVREQIDIWVTHKFALGNLAKWGQ